MSFFRSLIIFFVFSLFLPFTLSTASTNADTSASKTSAMTPEKWIEDLNFLEKELPVKHKNLFFKLSEADYHKQFEELRGRAAKLKDYEITVAMMQIVASVGDAHTGLVPLKMSYFHRLPLLFMKFKDGVYIVSTLATHKQYLGKRVTGVGSYTIEEAIGRIKTLIPYDNDAQIKLSAPLFMSLSEVLAALNLTDDPGKVTFELENAGKAEVAAIMEMGPHMQAASVLDSVTKPLYMQASKNYWYEFQKEKNTLYIQYRRCADMKNQPFEAFSKEVMSKADSLKPDKIVIDMRSNGGGNSEIAKPLIEGIISRPEINRKGHLFVITGASTFSSAILNALDFQDRTEAIFAGEPTAGRPNHYGEVRSFKLPNSGYDVNYSTKYFSDSKEDIPSFLPNITIEPGFNDFAAGKDPVMDAIYNYDNSKPSEQVNKN
ncbi:MAG: peptidase S41 [Bacillota bacterium]